MANHDPSTTQTTLNIPQIAVLLLVGFLAVRWIFSSNTPPTQQHPGRAASRGAGPRVNPAHVETVSQMFPQLSRRDIMWDLQRNGGNVQATTERLLNGRRLETVGFILQCSDVPRAVALELGIIVLTQTSFSRRQPFNRSLNPHPKLATPPIAQPHRRGLGSQTSSTDTILIPNLAKRR